MNPLKMLSLVCPTGKDFLNDKNTYHSLWSVEYEEVIPNLSLLIKGK